MSFHIWGSGMTLSSEDLGVTDWDISLPQVPSSSNLILQKLGALGVSKEIIVSNIFFLFQFVSFFLVLGIKYKALQGLARQWKLRTPNSPKWIML